MVGVGNGVKGAEPMAGLPRPVLAYGGGRFRQWLLDRLWPAEPQPGALDAAEAAGLSDEFDHRRPATLAADADLLEGRCPSKTKPAEA